MSFVLCPMSHVFCLCPMSHVFCLICLISHVLCLPVLMSTRPYVSSANLLTPSLCLCVHMSVCCVCICMAGTVLSTGPIYEVRLGDHLSALSDRFLVSEYELRERCLVILLTAPSLLNPHASNPKFSPLNPQPPLLNPHTFLLTLHPAPLTNPDVIHAPNPNPQSYAPIPAVSCSNPDVDLSANATIMPGLQLCVRAPVCEADCKHGTECALHADGR